MNFNGRLRDFWPLFAAGLVVGGLAAQNSTLVIIGFAVGLIFGAASLWARYSLRRLRYERIIPEDHAFPGESIAVTMRLTNPKPLLLPWIEVADQFPESMSAPGEEGDLRPAMMLGVVGLDWHTSIGSYQRVSRSLALSCNERGVYELGPAEMRSGDPFGLFDSNRTEVARSRIVVYPRTAAFPAIAFPARRPFGELAGGLRVYEDPARVAGIRDYQSGDSLRRIDWNATARLGKLQSRVYEPSSSRHLLVCVNTQTVIPAWSGYIPEMLERAISVGATVVRDAYDDRFAVGLLANASVLDADRPIRIPPGRRPEQLIRVLEALAVISPFVLAPLATQLDQEEHKLTVGTTIAVVTGVMTDDLSTTLLRLHRRGHGIVVLTTTGDRWEAALADIPVHDVSEAASSADQVSEWRATVPAR